MRFRLRTLLIVLAILLIALALGIGAHFGMVAICDVAYDAAVENFSYYSIHPGWYK